jgi:type II secretory ATPase GspE/PulE/Tfp pilus assembly ATPase PilB-like protein
MACRYESVPALRQDSQNTGEVGRSRDTLRSAVLPFGTEMGILWNVIRISFTPIIENTMKTESDNPASAPPVTEHLTARVNKAIKDLDGGGNTDMEAENLTRLILQDALMIQASDIHLDPFSSGVCLRLRVDGVLHNAALLPLSHGQRLIRYFKTSASLDPTVSFAPQDSRCQFNYGQGLVELRLASTPSYAGEKLSLRVLDTMRIRRQIAELGFRADDERQFMHWRHDLTGFCFVTGPSGSGKTTTLYALLHELKMLNRSIITIEDPVEYQIDGITQIQVDPRHGLTFASGLKSMLRLDPDYLLMGEIRDLDSAHTALEAVSSGRALMATLHARDAAGVVASLHNWGLSMHEIAAHLELVISQRLVRRLCQKCRRPGSPSPVELEWLKTLKVPVPTRTWRAVGCSDCHLTGYLGRMGLFEIWRKAEVDYELILSHPDQHALRRKLRHRGIKSLLEDGMIKVGEGLTSLSELQVIGGLGG